MSLLPALLALEDGSLFRGCSVGIRGQSTGEVVFNTAMTGYQEVLSDPSYASQIVTLTYPHIGNTGTNGADQESARVWAAGLVIRDLPALASSWRSEQSLQDYLQQQRVIAIADIDTRRLTRILREKGALKGCVIAGEINENQALAQAHAFAGLQGIDLAKEVTTAANYVWQEGSGDDWRILSPATNSSSLYHVVAYDFGIKRNILRCLVDAGCRVTVVPAQTTAQAVLALQPDGVFLSNGPGDPAPCDYAIAAISELLERNIPLFGICLGHQLLALTCGAKTQKMKFGHHGANHPVQELATGKVLISSQNHSFVVDRESLPNCLTVTHVSLFDQSIQGLAHTEKPAFSFQGHPEASPGPQDITPLFRQFVTHMQKQRLASAPSGESLVC